MMLSPSPSSSSSPGYPMSSFSPAGLHVLVVDDDPLCLLVLERMLRLCNYKVTTSNSVSHALQLLRENSDNFDLVLSDVYMPDEDGFKLLEIIGLELDLPVIMMSANGETTVVMKGITHGACDYLIKPVRMEELRNIWQHVVRKKGKDFSTKSDVQGEFDDITRFSDESQEILTKKRKEQESLSETADCNIDDISSLKKARVNWSVQLHQQFVNAVNQLGVDRAVPKRILEIMNVQGLTRENVASHLQKYRLYLKRLSGVVPEPYPIASFQAAGNGSVGGTMRVQLGSKVGPCASLPTVKGLNLGAGVGSGPARARKIDSGTMKSLGQFKLHQQKQVANRAQVLSSLGLSDQRPVLETGLQRMSSLDLSFFLQAQYIDSPSPDSADMQPNNESTCGHGLLRAAKLEEGVAELHRPMQGWRRHVDSGDKLNGGPGLSTEATGTSLGVLPSVVLADDAGSSTSTETNVAACAHGQVSTNSMSCEVFSDCSFDALAGLGPPLNFPSPPLLPLNLPSPTLLPPYMHSTELDIADYLQLDDQASFTCHN